MEFLTVGDYGKENNIKADFLGLHKEINGVQHHEVDLTDKWVATISTQKGCPMKCKFCKIQKKQQQHLSTLTHIVETTNANRQPGNNQSQLNQTKQTTQSKIRTLLCWFLSTGKFRDC